jgi:hypothetical protein
MFLYFQAADEKRKLINQFIISIFRRSTWAADVFFPYPVIYSTAP